MINSTKQQQEIIGCIIQPLFFKPTGEEWFAKDL